MAAQKIAVLCIGNILMLDEGVASHLARNLIEHYDFVCHDDTAVLCADILDRGTMGMSLISDMEYYDTILIVDAVDNTGKDPGTIVSFQPDDIAPYEAWHGAHDTRLADVLAAATLLGYTPQVTCLGVQIQDMYPSQYTMDLTPPVREALPKLEYHVCDFLHKHSVEIIDKRTGGIWTTMVE
jgi:hydrogenase maturation protease